MYTFSTPIPAGAIRLFEADNELVDQLDRRRQRTARQIFAQTWALRRGYWEPDANPLGSPFDYGLLLVEGLLLCRSTVGKRTSAELLGVGDALNAAHSGTAPHASVTSEVKWFVLAPARLALLDAELVAKAAMLPGVLGKLHDRALWRARSLAFQLAIVQMPQLTSRIHVFLWHLADRWGYRRAGNVVVPFRIPHQVIAECVSAHRTSVSKAIRRLAAQGLVARDPDGLWILHGPAPVDF